MNLNDFDHVILLAHGSTDPKWKLPFEKIHQKVLSVTGSDKCSLAYMELSEPSFETVVESLGAQCTKIAVLPLFFAVGRHLRHDVPKKIEALQIEGRTIELLPPIGDDEKIQQAMVDIVSHHLGN
jgi:sirohydrochlorin cobaltochelatase